jgi:hypothetical protein
MTKEYKGVLPIERWIRGEHLDGGNYILKEHSLLLPGQILTLLEIEAAE